MTSRNKVDLFYLLPVLISSCLVLLLREEEAPLLQLPQPPALGAREMVSTSVGFLLMFLILFVSTLSSVLRAALQLINISRTVFTMAKLRIFRGNL